MGLVTSPAPGIEFCPNRRILLIDDDPTIHDYIRRILEGPRKVPAGPAPAQPVPREDGALMAEPAFEVDSAFQGETGLEMLRRARASQRPYALAFVDGRMPPGWDGIETVDHLWQEDPDLQVVICTAFADNAWSEIITRLDPADGLLILRKPFDNVEIRQITHTLLAKWALRRAHRHRVENLEALIAERTRDLVAANERLRQQGEERSRMEVELRLAHKLEAVGQLASGIAHELNTPIQFVADSLKLVQDSFEDLSVLVEGYRSIIADTGDARALERSRELETAADLEYLRGELPRAFERTFEGTRRVTTIVRAMKEFAHPGQGEKSEHDINQALRSTLVVSRNEYKYVADVETELGDLPLVACHIGDLNQVFLNLIINAAHAIGDVVKGTEAKGRIRVRTSVEDGHAVIAVSDSGTGIPPEIRDRIFDPFFTTKGIGKGTGQGLAIARSIVVDKHHGTLTFESEVGRGTTFLVRIPVGASQAAAGNPPAEAAGA